MSPIVLFQFSIMFPELNTVMSISSVLLLAMSGKDEAQTFPLSSTKDTKPSSSKPQAQESGHKVKYFNPHPSHVVSGLCSFRYFINRVPNRIPGKL